MIPFVRLFACLLVCSQGAFVGETLRPDLEPLRVIQFGTGPQARSGGGGERARTLISGGLQYAQLLDRDLAH